MTVDNSSANCAKVTICADEPYIGLVQALLNQRVEGRSQYCRDSYFDQCWQAFQFVCLGEKITNNPDLILYLVDADDTVLAAFMAQCPPLSKGQVGVFLVYVEAGQLSPSLSDSICDLLSSRGFIPVFVFGESRRDAANELFLALWSITGPILMPGLMGVDFYDISRVIQMPGCVGYYGHGSASGEDRARMATEQALARCRSAKGTGFDQAVSCLVTVLSDVSLGLEEFNTAAGMIYEMIPGNEVHMVCPTVIDYWLSEQINVGLVVLF